MKKIRLLTKISIVVVLFIAMLTGSCSKSTTVTPTPPVTISTSSEILYRKLDNAASNNELWTVNTDGTSNAKLAITLPSGWALDNDVVAEISTDYKTIAALAYNESLAQYAIYKSNIDGTNVQQVLLFSKNVIAELQCFIDQSSILYWKTNDSNSADDGLWRVNADGTGNQKINAAIPANNYGDGKFAKVTSDGKTIVFSTFNVVNTESSTIYKCNIDGSNLTTITTESTVSTSIKSLVNDNAVLYIKTNSTTYADEVWSVNFDGTNKHQIPIVLPSGLSLDGEGGVKVLTNSTMFFVTTTTTANSATDQEAIYTSKIDGSAVKLVTQIPAGYTVIMQGLKP